jgi:hypothetical protein
MQKSLKKNLDSELKDKMVAHWSSSKKRGWLKAEVSIWGFLAWHGEHSSVLVVDGATMVGGGAPFSWGAVALRTGGALMARFDAEDVDPVPLRTCAKDKKKRERLFRYTSRNNL